MFRIILVLWRQLDEQAAELPAIVQRKHQIGELVQFFLYWFSERFEQFMSYCLWKFGVENEVARRVSIPPYHHALFRKRVEGGIYFDGLNTSYYELPAISSASDWRKRVPDDFRFSVRCPRLIVDHYGLNLLPGARSLLERLGEVCNQLEAVVMTVLINPGSQIKESELAARLSDFLGAFNSDKTVVAVEFRGVNPSAEVFDIMKESEAIDSVDLSNSEPRYEGKVLYSRLFGKGEENIYEFDDGELKEIAKKASATKFEKSI